MSNLQFDAELVFSIFQSMFFFLAQTEQGDIFKITLETDEDMVRF